MSLLGGSPWGNNAQWQSYILIGHPWEAQLVKTPNLGGEMFTPGEDLAIGGVRSAPVFLADTWLLQELGKFHSPSSYYVVGLSCSGNFLRIFSLPSIKLDYLTWFPWTARRSNQSILKEINPDYALEGRKLKLKLQYFGHMMRRADSSEKTRCWERLRAGGEGGDRGWNGWMASLTQWTWVWANSER